MEYDSSDDTGNNMDQVCSYTAYLRPLLRHGTRASLLRLSVILPIFVPPFFFGHIKSRPLSETAVPIFFQSKNLPFSSFSAFSPLRNVFSTASSGRFRRKWSFRPSLASLFEGRSCIVAACGGFRRCRTPKVVSEADGRSHFPRSRSKNDHPPSSLQPHQKSRFLPKAAPLLFFD